MPRRRTPTDRRRLSVSRVECCDGSPRRQVAWPSSELRVSVGGRNEHDHFLTKLGEASDVELVERRCARIQREPDRLLSTRGDEIRQPFAWSCSMRRRESAYRAAPPPCAVRRRATSRRPVRRARGPPAADGQLDLGVAFRPGIAFVVVAAIVWYSSAATSRPRRSTSRAPNPELPM